MYKELETKVVMWAAEKDILDKATPQAQAVKTLEETTELIQAINNNDKDEIIDALGDILVTIIIQAKLQDVDLLDCLQSAYDVISKRKGNMVNGVFVKDNESDNKVPFTSTEVKNEKLLQHILGVLKSNKKLINFMMIGNEGVTVGRKAKLNDEQVEMMKKEHATGESIKEIMKKYNLSRASVYRLLAKDV